MNIFMGKRIIAAIFVACAMTGVQSLQAMKPGQGRVDLTSALVNLGDGGGEFELGYGRYPDYFKIGHKISEKDLNKSEEYQSQMRELLVKGADVNKLIDGDTPLFSFISKLSKNAINYQEFNKEKDDIHDLLVNVGNYTKYCDFRRILNGIALLLEHGAALDPKSISLAKDLVAKNQDSPWFAILDKYMKLVSNYSKQKDNASKVSYIKGFYPYSGSTNMVEYRFLVKVCFGRSLMEVNLDKSKSIRDTAFYNLYMELGNREMRAVLFGSEGLRGEDRGLDQFIMEAAQKNGYYLRPNFFSPVKQQVVQKPLVPAKPKGLVVSPVKQEVKPVVSVKTGAKPVVPAKPTTKPVVKRVIQM